MRVVIEALPVVPFGGYAVGLEGLLSGWDQLDSGDEIHLMLTEGVELKIPESIRVHRYRVGSPAILRRPVVQSRAAKQLCAAVDADVLLGILPTTAMNDVGCPKAITVYDLRHELVPEQFSLGRRLLRKLSYDIGYRQAGALLCISERTRRDLLRSRPWLASKIVVGVLFGADHVDGWRREPPAEPYAIAFGHFPNKAVSRVLDAWQLLHERGEARPLLLVGLPGAAREAMSERIRAAGLDGVVTLAPWLSQDEFEARFASAGLVVFPSEFEGFGLPAVEAMRLGIPLVISDDEALMEVTGGNAAIVSGSGAAALADAVAAAWASTPEDLARASAWVEPFTWARTAQETRAVLEEVVARPQLGGGLRRRA